ncbi:MAG: phosphohydrolase [Actinomycetota bacterium]|nr:phosphohydrolase [Actinomycetota bacterium]
MDSWSLLFAGSAAIDVALALWVALRRGRGRRIGRQGGLALALWVAKLWLLVQVGMDPFLGYMHVLWLDLVLAVPAFGLALAATGCGRRHRAVGLAGLALALMGVWGSFVAPGRLMLERESVALPAARAGDRPITVGVLADLQFERVGEHEREAVDRLMALRPDVIVLPGDVHQGSPGLLREELPAIRELLSRLRAPGGVWFVEGDHEDQSEARLITAGTRVRLLDAETATITVGDRRLTIGGVGLRYRSAGARDVVSRLERASGDDDVRLLLAHRPDTAFLLPPRPRTDLVVAGHTHGGQVALPFVGPLMAFTDVPLSVAAGGLHDLGQARRIYVSRGVGVERGQAPRVRLNVPPEISLLTLG